MGAVCPILSTKPPQKYSQPDTASGIASLIVAGNANVGKSVIFQLLTGRYATVSNYPGTTVMVSSGLANIAGKSVRVFDTPGLHSLLATSEDELVARDLLLGHSHCVLQVGDAKNLQRTLALTLELAEAGVCLVLDLNMVDEARECRVNIDFEKLQHLLGVPVVATIATQRWGMDRLRSALTKAKPSIASVRYPEVIEQAAQAIEQLLPEKWGALRTSALLWLAKDERLMTHLRSLLDPDTSEKITRIVDEAAKRSAHPLGRLILQARLKQAARLTEQVMRAEAISRRPWSDRLAATMIHPFWGYPILIAVLLVMYFLVGDLAAQKGVNFFEEVLFGRTIAPLSHWLITHLLPLEILQALFIGEYGLLTMALPYAFAIILPIVGMFFLCFGILEDVGYLPRLAVMADRACRLLGLNGKAVLPLVLGLGCVTMGTMTTRILDSKKERLLATLVLALGIPCSAQLGVILAMLAGQPMLSLLIWMSVVATVVITVGRLCSYWLGGETSFFLYELPPLRKPKLSNILIKTLGRLEWYVKEAVPLFFAGTLALFLLDRTGWLATLESWLEPVVVGWLGLPAKAADALLIGFLRRDFGAAGFFEMQRRGMLDGTQTIVSLVTITLFVPCVAQYFMMIKERGWRTASAIAAVATGIAVGVGGILLRLLRAFPIS